MTLQHVYDVLHPLGITNAGFKNLMRWVANEGKLVELQAVIERNDLVILDIIIHLSNDNTITKEGGDIL
jgi:hypothetical protein